MSNRKRFYISVIWMTTVILAGLAMLLAAVTHT